MSPSFFINRITCCVLFFLVFYQCFGTSLVGRFRRYTIDDSLSHDTVSAMIQDSKGFLWVGTKDGLNRFDGYRFRVFRKDVNDPDSISDNHIRCFMEGRDGSIWVGTYNGGLNRYNPADETFRQYAWSGTHLGQNRVLTIHEDSNGRIWVGGVGGLSRLDESSGGLISQPGYFFSSTQRLRTIFEDKDGILWLGGDNGLSRFDPETESFKAHKFDFLEKGQEILINHIYAGREGYWWLASSWGLIRLEPESGESVHFPASRNMRLRAVMEDRKGNLWLAGHRSLGRLNRTTGEIQTFGASDENGGRGITSVHTLLEDNAGNIWVGTSSGLYSYNTSVERFNYTSPEKHLGGGHNGTSAFYLDEPNKLWIGTMNGLIRKDRSRGDVQIFTWDKDRKDTISHSLIWCILEDSGGDLWIGTQLGLNRYLPETQSFERHFFVEDYLQHVGNQVMRLAEGEGGSLWAGTPDGLYRYKPGQGVVETFHNNPNDPTTLSMDTVFVLKKDSENRLWVGTYGGGLNLLLPQSGTFRRYVADDNQSDSLGGNNILSILESRDGVIWVGTNYGLGRMIDAEAGAFRVYDTADGLSSNAINSIAQDERGRIWMGTERGLSILDLENDNIYNFDTQDGLQSDLFNQGAVFRSNEGELFFGGTNGFNSFFPREIARSEYQPQVWITDFKLNNVSAGSKKDNPDSPFDKPVDETDKIVLKPSQRVFSFEFASLDFTRPARNHMAFKLEGFNGDWTETAPDQRLAVYTNLDPGPYVFRVKGTNKDGIWSDNEARMEVVILPPFYQTWWARLFYVLVFGLVLYVYWRTQEDKLAKERQLAEKDRLIAEKERQTVARLRQIDHLKDEFLANTSHELRTPLNGIIGLAESLMAGATGSLPETTVKNLSMIVSSGRRLASLVNDILDFSKLKNRNLQLRRRPVDMGTITEVVLALSQPLVGKKNLKLVNDLEENVPSVEGDERRLQQIMHNLVGNAVKFTEEGTVTVSARVTSPWLTITVTDTGVGIAPDKLETIFQSFEQVDGTEVRGFGGTGLGLAITRQLIELHGGEITVKSTPGVGSTFSFTMPLARVMVERSSQKQVRMFTEKPFEDNTHTHVPDQQNGGPTILIVDDEPINRQVLVNHLHLSGFKVIEAGSGSEALTIMEGKEDVALIVLDVMMPGMSGYEVCRKLREHFSIQELPVLFLTAKDQDQDLSLAFDAGGNDYLTKPVSKTELITRVENHLELRETHRNLEGKVAERTQDLTRKNEELVRTRNQLVLQEKMSSLGTLTAGIAHEIQNPLNFVNNFADTAIRLVEDLEESLQPLLAEHQGEVGEILEDLTVNAQQISNHGRRAERIVKNMLELSSEASEAPKPTPLNNFVQEFSALPLRSDDDKAIELMFEWDEQIGDVLIAPRNMTRVLVNLVRNSLESIEAMRAKQEHVGQIKVSTHQFPDRIEIRIWDNGEGISEQHLGEIFNPFFTTRHDNIGLGLSISYDIVTQEHHGGLTVDSVEGEYACFNVILPRNASS